MASLRRLSLGLYGPTSSASFQPFLNWWKIAGSPTITRSAGGNLTGKAIWDAGTYLNTSTGEILNPAPSDLLTYTRTFFGQPIYQSAVPNVSMAGETWVAEWDGSATVVANNIGTGGTQSASGSNKRNITFGSNPDQTSLTFTLTNLNDPPRNIRVYQSRYSTNVANGEKFNPDWLLQVKKFGELRFMDWIVTNDSTLTDFSQFADESYVSWGKGLYDGVSNSIAASDHGPKGMLHPSLICQLAALTGCKIHVNIPYLATDACVTAMATYYKNNCTQRVTYEYANEHWNSQFQLFRYTFNQGLKIWGTKIQSMTAGSPTTIVFVSPHGLNGTPGQNNTDFITDAVGWTGLNSLSNALKSVTVVNSTTVTIPWDTTGFPAFSSTDSWGSQDFGRNSKWYGKRASEIMKIIRDVYNDRTRWNGALATQNAGATVTNNVITGINYWRQNILSPANSLAVNDLFDGIYVTGYFGDTIQSAQVTGITQANPGRVAAAGHGFSTGQRVKLNIAAGMTQLNGTFATVTVIDGSTFDLQGVDTTAMSAYSFNIQNWVADAKIFDLMDQSNTNFINTPGTYPTKYTYYNQQLATSFLTGTCTFGFNTVTNITTLLSTVWPAQYAIAKANGLELRQYEGGCHFVGSTLLSGSGISSQFNEYMVQMGHSSDIANVYKQSYKAFIQAGGKTPSKFVEAGTTSQFGTWAGIRYWKSNGNGGIDDTGNPVWLGVLDYNDNAHSEVWTMRFGA